jgi:hypothetical protein
MVIKMSDQLEYRLDVPIWNDLLSLR